MTIVRHQRLTILVLWLNAMCNAWVNLPTPAIARTAFQQRYNPVLYSTKADKEEKDQVAAESSSQNTSAVAEAPVVATKADEEDEDYWDENPVDMSRHSFAGSGAIALCNTMCAGGLGSETAASSSSDDELLLLSCLRLTTSA